MSIFNCPHSSTCRLIMSFVVVACSFYHECVALMRLTWDKQGIVFLSARLVFARLECCQGCKIAVVPFTRRVCLRNVARDDCVGCWTCPPDQGVDAGADAVFCFCPIHGMHVSLPA